MIRAAEPQDAEALAALERRAWLRAYADIVEPEHLGVPEERVARFVDLLGAGAVPGRTTLVYDVAGQVAGYASAGPARGPEVAGLGELIGLYVDPPAQGAGVGGALLTAAEDRLRSAGHLEAVLWVFEANEHARHVYERRGWLLEAPEVTRHLEGPDWWAPAVRYRREL